MKWQLVPAAQFGQRRAEWDALHAAGPASPLLHGDFVAALLDAFPADGLLMACCDDAGGRVAMALLRRQGRASWSTFQPAQAPLGIWLQRGDGGAAAAPPSTHDAALRAAMLASLLPALPGVALLVGLTQCDPWLVARPAPDRRLHTLDYIASAHIEVDQSFETYWSGRGKNLRANLKKQRARLDRDGVRTSLRIVRDSAAVDESVAAFGRLESAGWKAGSGSAVSADNDQGRFYRAMLEAFCRRGAGCIYSYYFDEQLVAMDLCIEAPDYVIILKTAYDESQPAHLSPAILMREEACRALFDGGRVRRIEFYGKVMEWHRRWTDDVRTLYHINYYRWPLVKRLHLALAPPPTLEPECTSTK